MMNAAEYRRALLGEVESIRVMLGDADDETLGRESACPGWSVLDVARHVEITPRTIAGRFTGLLGDKPSPHVEPLASSAGSQSVLASFDAGFRSLDAALGRLRDEDLDDSRAGHLGPAPSRRSLDQALTELTLHRCDIALGLGMAADIDPTAAVVIVDVLQGYLLLIAPPSPAPPGPLCYRLSDGSHEWTFRFEGTQWGRGPCAGELRTITARAPAGRLALALAGRVPLGRAVDECSDPVAIAELKTYLPGP